MNYNSSTNLLTSVSGSKSYQFEYDAHKQRVKEVDATGVSGAVGLRLAKQFASRARLIGFNGKAKKVFEGAFNAVFNDGLSAGAGGIVDELNGGDFTDNLGKNFVAGVLGSITGGEAGETTEGYIYFRCINEICCK